MRLILLTALLLLSGLADASLIDVIDGELNDRVISYAPPGDENLLGISGVGIFSSGAADPYGASQSTAKIVSGGNSALINLSSTLTKSTTGRQANNRLDVTFSISESVNYSAFGTAVGVTTDATDRFRTSLSVVDFLAGPSIYLENDEQFGPGSFGLDGVGAAVSGSSSGTLGPGTYLVRMASQLVDSNGDGLGDASLGINFNLQLSALAVPAPYTLMLLMLGLALMGFRRVGGWLRP